ncbi:hypothetical protein SPRG_01574 [Saprolegnia parasitica CBS 223.65]|uniref:Kinesin-like protein n=1 Tax=Saprolegnia parasitica (strain CBS 223.65) TaxID=695850 RepID=A0A067CUP5_SAPPC|nr:hypothetical protein SPRG_01574 [Saprolegnia parasitica CBS 223.65]KDO34439.1 hypothetical protein SPRG_01574 [Saprolegnia parasitica CBS 223.65]|eukprot:XP_012195170.1 hypothetical protein SPRG_01574 [Saprolegnia parasitica CBS 223.65]
MAERIQVGVRCRPPPGNNALHDASYALELEPNAIHIVPAHSRHVGQRSFAFDHVWAPGTSQAQVYDQAVAPLVAHLLGGRSGAVLAYGQTGTGKSYTMGFLEASSAPELGIIPRVFEHLFAALAPTMHKVHMSFCQIYMETVHDLLVPLASSLADLPVRERDSAFYVDGLEVHAVTSLQDARSLVHVAMANRALAATGRNATSSRSHSLLTISVSTTSWTAQLVLVDLAGSERSLPGLGFAHDATKARLLEAKSINSSLSALGNVMSSLASATRASYRDSKLTKLLKGVLRAGSTVVLATVDGAAANLAETLSTLKFAARCRHVTLPKRLSIESSSVHKKAAAMQTVATQTEALTDVDVLRDAFQKKEIELHMLYQEQLYKLRRALERLSARPDDKAVAAWSVLGDRTSTLARHDDDGDDVLSVSTEDGDEAFNQVEL